MVQKVLGIVLLLTLVGCNDPLENAPVPPTGPGNDELPANIIQAHFLNNYFSYSTAYDFWGQSTGSHYEVNTGTVYMTRGAVFTVEDQLEGTVPQALWSIILDNVDLDRLPVPYTFGATRLPPDYSYNNAPTFYVQFRSYLGSLPTYELNTTGNVGQITYAQITHKTDDVLKGTFSGQFWHPARQQYVVVTDGRFHIPLVRR